MSWNTQLSVDLFYVKQEFHFYKYLNQSLPKLEEWPYHLRYIFDKNQMNLL